MFEHSILTWKLALRNILNELKRLIMTWIINLFLHFYLEVVVNADNSASLCTFELHFHEGFSVQRDSVYSCFSICPICRAMCCFSLRTPAEAILPSKNRWTDMICILSFLTFLILQYLLYKHELIFLISDIQSTKERKQHSF